MAFAGHYYSYIKERSGSKGSRSSGRDKNHTPQWFLFDDNRVEPYNIENLEADCFGGKYTMEVYDSYLKENTIQEHERHYSAYMLLYENCSQAVENVSVSQVADDLNDAEPETAEGDADEDKIIGILKSLVTEMPKGRGKTKAMPLSVLHSIVEQNLKFGHESKLLSAEYDEFFLNLLINVASKWCNGPHNLHATNTPSKDKDTCDLSEEGDESRNPESYWREYAIFSVRLATQYFFRVYFRVHSSLRPKFEEWKELMVSLMATHDYACDFFLRCIVTECRDDRQPCRYGREFP